MHKYLRRFGRDENGAVTVDWVVLTAAIVGLGFAIVYVVVTGAKAPAEKIGTALTELDASSF